MAKSHITDGTSDYEKKIPPIVTVLKCSNCGGTHIHLTFKYSYQYYACADCPATWDSLESNGILPGDPNPSFQ